MPCNGKIVVKYTNFIIFNINGIVSAFGGDGLSFLHLALPLGISFYTFQAIGYLIDVYWGTVPAERSFTRFALFISFFPQLIQGPISRYGDLSETLFATGVWHGASWNFIVWGLGNWVVLMVSEELEPLYAKFHRRFSVGDQFWYRLFQVGRTFLLVCMLNLFDCYPSLSLTFGAIASMFTAGNWSVLWNGALMELGLSGVDYGILAAGIALMLAVSLARRSGSVREKLAQQPYPVRFIVWYGLFLIVLLTGAYGVGYDAGQFIYNQF